MNVNDILKICNEDKYFIKYQIGTIKKLLGRFDFFTCYHHHQDIIIDKLNLYLDAYPDNAHDKRIMLITTLDILYSYQDIIQSNAERLVLCYNYKHFKKIFKKIEPYIIFNYTPDFNDWLKILNVYDDSISNKHLHKINLWFKLYKELLKLSLHNYVNN